MSGNNSVNRNVFLAENRQRKCQRNLQWQTFPRLRTSNWKCWVANSEAVNHRLDEAVDAGSEKSTATWKVRNVGDKPMSAAELVNSRGELCIPGRQPGTWCVREHAANEGWWVRQRHGQSDLSRKQPYGCIKNRLQTTHKIRREARKYQTPSHITWPRNRMII